MAIAKVMGDNKVTVSNQHRLMSLIDWFDAQKLTIQNDYNYGGLEKDRYVFAFASKDAAMLFKLTFGGL